MPEIISRQQAKALGLKRYFTGKACKRGHVDERYVRDAQCASCSRIKCRHQMARRRQIDPAGEREKVNLSYLKHRASRIAKMKEYNSKRVAALKALRKLGIIEDARRAASRPDAHIKRRSYRKRIAEDPMVRERQNAHSRGYYWRNHHSCKTQHQSRSKMRVAAFIALKQLGIKI